MSLVIVHSSVPFPRSRQRTASAATLDNGPRANNPGAECNVCTNALLSLFGDKFIAAFTTLTGAAVPLRRETRAAPDENSAYARCFDSHLGGSGFAVMFRGRFCDLNGGDGTLTYLFGDASDPRWQRNCPWRRWRMQSLYLNSAVLEKKRISTWYLPLEWCAFAHKGKILPQSSE